MPYRLDGTSKSTEWFQQHGRVTPGVDKKRKKKPSPKDVKAKSQPPSQSEKNSPEIDNFSITPLHSEASKGLFLFTSLSNIARNYAGLPVTHRALTFSPHFSYMYMECVILCISLFFFCNGIHFCHCQPSMFQKNIDSTTI